MAFPTNQNGWDDPNNVNVSQRHPRWTLVFEDEFTGSSYNQNNWSRIPYIKDSVSDWRKYQSTDESLVEMTGDTVKLWGRYGKYTSQSNQAEAANTYACGGLHTLDTFTFQYGYVEVQARFDCTQGCWPAIWMMPVSNNGNTWPYNGEIDIMEHLNNENQAYQTLHYGTGDCSKQGVIQTLNPAWKDNWHTWGMEWTPDAITFYCDGMKYNESLKPRNNDDWPFGREGNEFYLIIDQQIGGTWVGSIDQSALKNTGSAMEVNYVRVYSDPKYMHLSVPEPATATLALLGVLALAARRRRT